MKWIVPVLLGLLPLNAIAEDSFLPIGTVIMCKSSAAVGFDWKNGTYHETRYKGDTRIFKKVPMELCRNATVYTKEYSAKGFLSKVATVCITHTRLSDDPWQDGGICNEWIYRAEDETLQRQLSCRDESFVPDVYLTPNGYYHLATIHGALEKKPRNDHKDSQYVEWGLCSVISEP